MMHKPWRAACLLLAVSLASAQTSAPTSTPSPPVTTYITPEALFQASPLPPGPPAGSTAAAADLQAVLAVQAVLAAQQQRTPADVQDALRDADRGPVAWAQDAEGLGATFTEQRYPATTALLLALHEDMRAVNRAGNTEKGHRARLGVVDSRIQSIFAENLTQTASYPSARSASSRVWALLLADIFPDRRAALHARADRTAELRLLGGAHFPSDILAGKQVGDRYYLQFSGNAGFQQALRKAMNEAKAAKP